MQISPLSQKPTQNLMILTETSDLMKSIQGYKIEESSIDLNGKCQAIMLIKNCIECERIEVADNEENPIVVIKIQTKKNENEKTSIKGHYRQ